MQLKFWQLDLKLKHKWAISERSGISTNPVVIVEITLPDGTVGLGEASPSSRYGENVEICTAFFQKIDPGQLSVEDIPASMKYLEKLQPGAVAAKGAINVALWDAAGKKARQPIYDMLGLGFQENKHVTCFSIGIDRPEIIRRKVEQATEYPYLKLKVGDPGDDQNLAALRAVSPSKWIRGDANEGWKTKEEALAQLEKLANAGRVQFVEQPMPTTTPAKDWKWLKERTPLPILADESYHTAADADICAECFHGVNVKLVKAGGITGAFEALKAARQRGLKTMLGCMIETSILITAGAHLAELTDYLDLDGNLLITNDPYIGVSAEVGAISFAKTPARTGLRVSQGIDGKSGEGIAPNRA